jgi:hypothetical protein
MSKTYYVWRHGKRIEVEDITPRHTGLKRRKRQKFAAPFTKFPRAWAEALQQTKSAKAWQLAEAILAKAFELECSTIPQKVDEIILSSKVTKLPRNTKARVAKELAGLGLIHVERSGNGALRVTRLLQVDGAYKILT